MKMKLQCLVLVSGLLGALASSFVIADDRQILLKAFHKYGITKCDSFISENSELKSNWNFFISKHAGGIDGPTTEVTATRIFGTKGDTVKVEDTYIQTRKSCFLRQTYTLTGAGACSDNMDGNSWYVDTPMPSKDYATYKNAGGIEVHAKEISMGNFKACIQEGSKRISSDQG